jgi:hypothetical protein
MTARRTDWNASTPRACGEQTARRIRFPVEPRDVPPEKAARRLHVTLAEFTFMLPALMDRGFPGADPTTGMFDLEAIDLWRHSRHPHLFGLQPLTPTLRLRDFPLPFKKMRTSHAESRNVTPQQKENYRGGRFLFARSPVLGSMLKYTPASMPSRTR